MWEISNEHCVYFVRTKLDIDKYFPCTYKANVKKICAKLECPLRIMRDTMDEMIRQKNGTIEIKYCITVKGENNENFKEKV